MHCLNPLSFLHMNYSDRNSTWLKVASFFILVSSLMSLSCLLQLTDNPWICFYKFDSSWEQYSYSMISIYEYELLISSRNTLKRNKTLHVQGHINHSVPFQEKSPPSYPLDSTRVSQSGVQGLFLNKHTFLSLPWF